MSKFVVSLTGASGSVFADLLIRELLKKKHEVFFISSDQGKKVYAYEMDCSYEKGIENYQQLAYIHETKFTEYDNQDLFAPIASGSVKVNAVIIVPCSMGTLGKIANGISDSLILRSADVAIKEKRKLILVARETPLSSIHLSNMLKISDVGGIIMPPVPAMYAKPKTLQESNQISVGRILDFLDIENELSHIWGGEHE